MHRNLLTTALASFFVIASAAANELKTPIVKLETLQERAARHQALLQLPRFAPDAKSVRDEMSQAITRANTELDKIGALNPANVTFENTVRALDDLSFEIGKVGNRIYLAKETSPEAAIREAGTEAIKQLEEWTVGITYREDDYRRAGLHLPRAQRDEIERLRKELAALATDFDSNVTAAQLPVRFTKADLDGVPESFLTRPGVKTGEDEYTVMANITWHFVTVMENARKEAARQRLKTARYSLAKDENLPLLQKIVELRDRVAGLLGYSSWADYQIEPKMAGKAANATEFLEKLRRGLEPKFAEEMERFRKLKAEESGDPDARLHLWDWRYYSNQLKKSQYAVDAEALRAYFPYERTLAGMFKIFEKIFRIRIEKLDPPERWVPDVELYAVSDSETGEPLGLFYLDMFPREGKYGHFAQFGLIEGKRLPDGRYHRPVVALICNFPPPEEDRPSLLSHQEVETLFHEFGHALHSIFTRANHVRFSGTSVPRDFVEAPSQMLENWVWDRKVLDTFAGDYRDPSKKIPTEILDQMKAARLATIGTFYRRQLAMGLLDLGLHTKVKAGKTDAPSASAPSVNAASSETRASNRCCDVRELSNRILSEVFLPVPEDSAFVAYFGHLTGYDAGYYGYAWADAIAADLATVFEKSPQGYFDSTAGLRLREEIYAPGNAREVTVSIQKFLGRETSIQPFLESIGIKTP
jgi:thimet oligopeptidase